MGSLSPTLYCNSFSGPRSLRSLCDRVPLLLGTSESRADHAGPETRRERGTSTAPAALKSLEWRGCRDREENRPLRLGVVESGRKVLFIIIIIYKVPVS